MDSLLGGLLVHCFQLELEFKMLVLIEGGKPEDPEKNPRSKVENRRESNQGHSAGRQALSQMFSLRTQLVRLS